MKISSISPIGLVPVPPEAHSSPKEKPLQGPQLSESNEEVAFGGAGQFTHLILKQLGSRSGHKDKHPGKQKQNRALRQYQRIQSSDPDQIDFESNFHWKA